LDLSLSPDFEAYWCYCILAALALIVAAVQVRALLKGFTNAWSTARAWLLLAAYTAVPVALFWVLDRADALHDTSVFAAILVAITYRQILSGGAQGVTVPGGFAKAWKPFVTWSDNIAAGIRDRIARNASQYDAKVTDHLATEPTVFDDVKSKVLNHSADPAQVQLSLDEFDKQKPPLDDAGVLQKKATYLYFALKALPEIDADKLLKDKKIITTSEYYLYAKEWRSRIFVGGFAVLVVVLLVIAAGQVRDPKYEARYYLWRFEKPNATQVDRFRAAQHLEQGMRSGKSDFVRIVRQELATRLRFDALPLDTADRMLQLFFQKTAVAPDASLIEILAESLRTDNPDLRVRTQKVLLYLAEECHLTIPEALRTWRPSKEDAATCVDTVANAWSLVAHSGASPVTDAALACLAEPGGVPNSTTRKR
jgi:hypothetical protein